MKPIKWTFEKIKEEALKYQSRSSFQKNANVAYQTAKKRNILDEVCKHMKSMYRSWTEEEILQEASKYERATDFEKSCPFGYALFRKLKKSGKCLDFKFSSYGKRVWNFDTISKEALKYNNRSTFAFKNGSAYQAAIKLGILEDVSSHMEESRKKWTDAEIALEALKYNSLISFRNNSTAYNIAHKRGLLEQVCKHMTLLKNNWSEDELIGIMLGFKSKGEFKKHHPNAYSVVLRRGLLSKVTHMKRPDKTVKWTKDAIAQEASKYNTRSEFEKNSPSAYGAALKLKIIDTVCSHMAPATNTSVYEKEIFDVVRKAFPKAQKLRERRIAIPGKPHIKGFDIDIYIPELRKGIEFDGDYFHSINGLKRGRPKWADEDLENYHKIKDDYFLSKGIVILHIKERDWLDNPESQLDKCMEFLK